MPNDVGNYRCVVSEPGREPPIPVQAALTLKTPTGFTQQPAATNACSGANATFTVVATRG